MSSPTDFSDLLRGRYKLGGRQPGVEIDCGGIMQECARRRGRPVEDHWERVERLWHEGHKIPDGSLGTGWRKVDVPPGDDHVVILETGREQGVGYVLGGYVWTASPRIGPVALPLERVTVVEVWEHDPAAR